MPMSQPVYNIFCCNLGHSKYLIYFVTCEVWMATGVKNDRMHRLCLKWSGMARVNLLKELPSPSCAYQDPCHPTTSSHHSSRIYPLLQHSHGLLRLSKPTVGSRLDSESRELCSTSTNLIPSDWDTTYNKRRQPWFQLLKFLDVINQTLFHPHTSKELQRVSLHLLKVYSWL